METEVRYVDYLRRGTPGSFLRSIDADDLEVLRKIADCSPDQLTAEGITPEQHDILLRFLFFLVDKESFVQQVENEIRECQRRMRDINLDPDHIMSGLPLTAAEQHDVDALSIREQAARERLTELRRHFDERLIGCDDDMRRTFESR